MIAVLVYVSLLVLIRATKLDPRSHKPGKSLCSAYRFLLLEARFGRETHVLCLKLKDIGSSPLTRHRAALLLDPDAESHNSSLALPLDDVTMAYGFPAEDPSAGSAEGYIGADGEFYGVLHLANRTLHADPYGSDDPTRVYGAFDHDHVIAPGRLRRDHARQWQIEPPSDDVDFPFGFEPRRRAPRVARARVCDLLLLADKQFFEKDANSSLDHVVRRMVHAVAQSDIIFRNTDFDEDGIPDNIGFSIKYILVLTSHVTNSRVFGDLLRQKTVDGMEYLMRFARLRRLSEVCLGVAFSGHAFINKTLGLSFTSMGGGDAGAAGGVCDRRAHGRSYNALALAHATAGEELRVPERVAALTLAHELGHSFGAQHDDNFANPECRGYIMGSQTPTAQTRRNFEFSLCSKRLITATLDGMGYCLAGEERPYCGNGIVEEGEACDCGLPSRCSQQDQCCTPRAGGALVFDEGTLHKEGCSVAPHVACHPSQGLCCTSDCKYADLSKHGIDCKTQDLECSCPHEAALCPCGLGGRCLPDGSCHAAECATLGLKECQCFSKGVGGTLGQKRMCGICCLLEAKDREGGAQCVGAEFAALDFLATGLALPYGWPDMEYKGPNVTLRLCHGGACARARVRAWAAGAPCVARRTVGLCAAGGVCRPVLAGTRPNVYPNTMYVRMMQQQPRGASLSTRAEPTVLTSLAVVMLRVVQ